MASNTIVNILAYQNQVAELKKRLEPFIETIPYHPEVVKLRLDLAYMEGQLAAHLEVAEIIHRS